MTSDPHADLLARLRAYLADHWPEQATVDVEHVASISSGWESELYRLDLADGREVVLRLYPGEGAARKCRVESAGMRTLSHMGYPVPRIYLAELAPEPLSKPFVLMEHVPGPLMMDAWPQRDPAGQQALLETFCSLLAHLHALDWHPLADENDDHLTRYLAGDPLALLDKELDHLAGNMARAAVPGFQPVMAWLRDRRATVPTPQPAILHLDYHPQNILLREEDDAPVVIDWTQIRVGDARFDLASTLMLTKSHVGDWLYGPFLQGYQALVGPVAGLDWFLTFCAVKRLYTVAVMFTYGPERLGMRAEGLDLIKDQLPAFRVVYQMLLDACGIAVPEVDDMLGAQNEEAS